MSFYEQLKRAYRSIPIIGSLGNTTLKSHGSAITEIVASFSISMMPIYGSWLILQIKPETRDQSMWTIFQNGELFIYASAILAPIIYIVNKDRSSLKAFPSRIAFMVVVIIITVLSSIIFTVERVYGSQTLPDNIIRLSFYVFLFSTLALYFALVYSNVYLPNPIVEMQKQDTDYSERVRQHRG